MEEKYVYQDGAQHQFDHLRTLIIFQSDYIRLVSLPSYSSPLQLLLVGLPVVELRYSIL